MSQARRLGVSKQKWSDEEEQALRQGVDKYGVGKWRQIQKDDAYGPRLINRSNVDLKDKWRNLNMDQFGSRGDKRSSRVKGRAKARARGGASQQPAAAAAEAPERETLNRQRKRKRRPERAAEAGSPLPYRPSSGALRALQEAALGPEEEAEEQLPARRRRRRPRALAEDEEDEAALEAALAAEEAQADEELGEDDDEDDEGAELEDGEDDADDDDEDDEDGDVDGLPMLHGFNNRTGPIPDDMVVAAIISLQDPVGSHPDDIIAWIERHYSVGSAMKRTLRSTLRAMVEAGRLEPVPHHTSLFRLGGVVRQLSQEAGMQWPRHKSPAGAFDPRTALQSAEAAARAVAEAEEAAALATRLMEAANRYDREAEAEGDVNNAGGLSGHAGLGQPNSHDELGAEEVGGGGGQQGVGQLPPHSDNHADAGNVDGDGAEA